MIIAVTAINDQGESLRMELRDPWSSGINIVDITGIGAPDADIQTTQIVSSDGDLYASSRAKMRTIAFKVKPMFAPDIETARQLTYKYFPVKKKVTLIFETDHRTLEIDGYTKSNDPVIFSKDQEISIEVECPRPFFKLSGDPVIAVMNGVEPMFEFPFSNEQVEPVIEEWTETIEHREYDIFGRVIRRWYETVYHRKEWDDRTWDETTTITVEGETYTLIIHHVADIDLTNWRLIMGEVREETEALVAYEGEADTGFVMQIHANLGPARNITVFNVNTAEEFIIHTDTIETITGKPFQMSDTIYISTVSGEKYARLFRGGNWYNIINAIDKNSDWLILRPGPNVFGYHAEEHEENLQFEMSYIPLYQGV